MTGSRRNWAGNQAYRARRVLEPESVEAVQTAVRSSTSMRVLGSRHAFNDLADTTGDHLSLDRLPRVVEIDRARGTVTVDGGIRYGELGPALESAGLALHNLASLPHISVAGACATATHGSGNRLGTLSTAVVAMELVRADGELITLSRAADGDAFAGSVVSLGALGPVTRLTLIVEPTYRVRQDVYEDLPIASLREHFDELTASGDSVSLFTQWRGPVVDQVWRKRRVRGDGARSDGPRTVRGAIRHRPAPPAAGPVARRLHRAARRARSLAGPAPALPARPHPEPRRRAPE